jgi:hypothetical protein
MLNTKLKVDRELNKKKKKDLKRKDTNKEEKEKGKKSKFANKYSERIASIKQSDAMREKRKQNIKNVDIDVKPKKKQKVEQEPEPENNIITPTKKSYEQIRKEMIEKFNNSSFKK